MHLDKTLPAECAALLRGEGFGANTVAEENLAGADDTAIARGDRLDFANIQASPSTHPGIIVRRQKSPAKPAVLGLALRIVSALKTRLPAGDLWIVEPDRIRFRTR
jgi:hypothetical protein